MENPTSEPEALTGRDDVADVWAWRVSRFLDLGVSYDVASRLAGAGVDHHELARLLERGCVIDTGIAILT